MRDADRCRSPYCANNPRSRTHEALTGELCDPCIREAEREDEENPVCPVCEDRKSEHGDVFPCQLDGGE